MSTFRVDLLFEGDPEAELPSPARAYIAVKPLLNLDADDGIMPITSDCVSMNELEAQAQRLRGELDAALAKARRKFTAYQKAQQNYLSRKTSTQI